MEFHEKDAWMLTPTGLKAWLWPRKKCGVSN